MHWMTITKQLESLILHENRWHGSTP
jgi:hypothetical protein